MKKTAPSKKTAVKKIARKPAKLKVAKKPLFSREFFYILFATIVLTIGLIFLQVFTAKADENPMSYIEGFESAAVDAASAQITPPPANLLYNKYGWIYTDPTNPNLVPVQQVASGVNGITAATGSYYGVVKFPTTYSDFSFPNTPSTVPGSKCVVDTPSEWYISEIDIYLKTTWGLGAGFNYGVELKDIANITNATANYRNFIFNVTRDTSTKKLLVGATSNVKPTDGAYGADKLSETIEAGDYVHINQTGWYTFRHVFHANENNTITTTMTVLDKNKQIVWEKAITQPDFDQASMSWNCKAEFLALDNDGDSTNVIANNFDLPIDNQKLILNISIIGPPTDKAECADGGWRDFNWLSPPKQSFKSQGDCISYVEANN